VNSRVKTKLQRAYNSDDVAVAKRQLQSLARQLETDHPSAAESLREGLDETLTIVGLGLSPPASSKPSKASVA